LATSDLIRRGEGRRFEPGAFRKAWARNRDLLGELVRRDLRARYRGSNLGILWSLFNPIIYMAIYSVVFSQFMRFPIKGAAYPVFLLSGLLAWNFFSQALLTSINSVLGNAAIVKKVAFPWVLLPLSAVIAAFINYLISLVLLIPVAIIFRAQLGLPLLALPLLVLLTFTLALGLSLLVAAGNVYFRDLEYLLNIVLQVGFFLTPIIYSMDAIGHALASNSLKAEVFGAALRLNPMAWVATSFQDVIAFNRWPTQLLGLLYSGVFSLVVLALGLVVFGRLQGRFAEEL
jgi:lipopolysaccharide transport system permease protein